MTTFAKILPILTAVVAVGVFIGCGRREPIQPTTGLGTSAAGVQEGEAMIGKVVKTDAEWRRILTPEQYRVMRQGGTEPAFSSPLYHEKRAGTYVCAACGLSLFSSKAKFDSGTGWPSFYEPIDPTHVTTARSGSLFIHHTEVKCARCGAHLGDVFDDGPQPTGLRYCIDGVALKFVPAQKAAAAGAK